MSYRDIGVIALGAALSALLTACGLNPEIQTRVRHATVEIQSETTARLGYQFAGTAFAIGPNEFATAAHVLDAYVGSDIDTPVVTDWQGGKHQIASVIAYSQRTDVAAFTLDPPLDVQPLQRAHLPATNRVDLWVAGHEEHAGVQFSYAYPENLDSREPQTIRFTGPVWPGLSGGPLFDNSGAALGVVSFGDPILGLSNRAAPMDVVFAARGKTASLSPSHLFQFLGTAAFNERDDPVEIALGQSFKDFAADVQRKRNELYARNIGSRLGAGDEEYSLYGGGASSECKLLNAAACTCVKPRPSSSGDIAARNFIIVDQFAPQLGPDTVDNLEGVVLIREHQFFFARPRSVQDASFHFDVARIGYTEQTFARSLHFDLGPLQTARPGRLKVDEIYRDASNRDWHLRVWTLRNQPHVLVSLARDLEKRNHVALMRAVPASAEVPTIMQLKYVANFTHACM